MKIDEVKELLKQVLPPKANFIVEVSAQYDSFTDLSKVIAFVSIILKHDGVECYSAASTSDELRKSFTKAVSDFQIWYGKTCGICWGTKRNCTICKGD